MEDKILLAELQTQLENIPSFETYDRHSITEHRWVSKTNALLLRYDRQKSTTFLSYTAFLATIPLRESNLNQITKMLYQVIADLQLRVPQDESQVYGPGAVYDFYRAIKETLATAQHSALMIDPYFDESVLDTYLPGLPQNVEVKILLQKYADGVKIAAEKYVAQHQIQLEVRSSKEFHDRIILIDDNSCWVVGQSFKDAANMKMTYLAPLPGDMAKLKKEHYDKIWDRATIVL